ncbi:MAG TPA: hypothetical protein VNZ58_09360 [Thermomicrobiales bacterium]|nr:hypothetical protein [Thermomicrobiales bacterium]
MTEREPPNQAPEVYSRQIRRLLTQVIDELEIDVGQVDDPHAMALFETSREVLKGLETAFVHFERGKESAWRR